AEDRKRQTQSETGTGSNHGGNGGVVFRGAGGILLVPAGVAYVDRLLHRTVTNPGAIVWAFDLGHARDVKFSSLPVAKKRVERKQIAGLFFGQHHLVLSASINDRFATLRHQIIV